jgi:hypothetical protein
MKFLPAEYGKLADEYEGSIAKIRPRHIDRDGLIIASALRIASRATEEGIMEAILPLCADPPSADGFVRAILKHLGEE